MTAALWSLAGVGVHAIHTILESQLPLEKMLEVPPAAWLGKVRVRPAVRQRLFKSPAMARVAERLEGDCRRLGQIQVFPGDSAWPSRLPANFAPMLFLKGRGDAKRALGKVAIVGTRHPEPGATDWIRRWSCAIAEAGVAVVSGGAMGVDQAAHEGALQGSGDTWAFLGCAIELRSASQRALWSRILDSGGSLFSQFPPGVSARPAHFVRRNPLIAGACDVVLVARAPRKSGALYTAQAAVALGRVLFSVPGEPWNPAAEGCNNLLKQKALPCLSPQDILETLNVPQSAAAKDVPSPKDPLARALIARLGKHSTDVDRLAIELECDPATVRARLADLEIDGLVEPTGTGDWRRVGTPAAAERSAR